MNETITIVVNVISEVVNWFKTVGQNPDGGMPSDKVGSKSCTWSTAGLLWALSEVGQSYREPYMQRALRWLLDNRNDDGGIPIVVKWDPSITDATSQCIVALTNAVVETGDDLLYGYLDECISWLLIRRLPDEGWNWRTSPEPSLLASSAYALIALGHASRVISERNIHDTLDQVTLWFKKAQNSDGGWGQYQGQPSSIPITGLVTYALNTVNCNDTFINNAMELIISNQKEDGSWDTIVDRPTGHSITRQGTPYCLSAVSFCKDQGLVAGPSKKGLEAILRHYKNGYFDPYGTGTVSWTSRDSLLALSNAKRIFDNVNS